MFEQALTANRCSGRMTDMTRTRVRRRRGAAVATVLFCLVAWSNVVARGAPQPRGIAPERAQQTYVVQEGDTLWSIAGRVGAGRDPRVVVEAIARANGIAGATVRPGQALVIPADAG
jgi:nucleoid-associated protein YgaU